MKTNLDKHYKVDSNLEKEGVTFVIQEANENQEEISMLVRHFSGTNPRVQAAMATYYKPYAYQIERGTLPKEVGDEITRKLFVDVCLVSWNGIKNEKGEAIECTKENAIELFKSLPTLFEDVWKHANNFQNYKVELGNS